MEYQSEEEFLKHYDSSKYEKLSMTADIIIISISSKDSNNYRKNEEKRMSVLLGKRKDYPYKDKWTLPGGFLDPKKETLEECARRVLKQETNLSDVYLEQLYTFDKIDRDPRMRVVSTAYVALVDKEKLKEEVIDAKWFDVIKLEEKNDVVSFKLSSGEEEISFQVKKTKKEKTSNVYEYQSVGDKGLAFDHDCVVLAAIERIRNKVNYTDIVFHMMRETFTLKELQNVYEVILNKKLLDPAFRRIIKNKVVKTNQMKTGEGHRPSVLFRYKDYE